MPGKRKRKSSRWFVRLITVALIICVGYFLILRYQSRHTSTKFSGLRELTGDFKSHGIDISRYQGEIDWNLFFEEADSTITFVYCKATEGVSHIDEQWEHNQEELRKNKKPFGVYHFFLPNASAELQAKHFLNNYTPEQNDLPPVLDVETEGRTDQQLIREVQIWLNKVEEAIGKRPVIYTSYHFYTTKFKNEFRDHKFWIANYNDRPDRVIDKRIIHWQYSDNGRIPGIVGPVDLNVSKIDFRD